MLIAVNKRRPILDFTHIHLSLLAAKLYADVLALWSYSTLGYPGSLVHNTWTFPAIAAARLTCAAGQYPTCDGA